MSRRLPPDDRPSPGETLQGKHDLTDRLIVVTGGSSGIGFAVADLALRHNARVVIAGSDAERTRHSAEALRGAIGEPLDVSDPSGVDSYFDMIEARHGPIDGVVASAGVSAPAPAASMSAAQWSKVVDVNLSGVFYTFRAAGRNMIKRGRGSLVAVASVNTFGGHANRANYAASKAGLAGLVRTLAIEWGGAGVRVNAVAPGPVDTPMIRTVLSEAEVDRTLRRRIPLGRLSDPIEQAFPILFLMTEAASFITGTVVPVDGGVTAGYFTDNTILPESGGTT